jgi:hypothetical protein
MELALAQRSPQDVFMELGLFARQAGSTVIIFWPVCEIANGHPSTSKQEEEGNKRVSLFALSLCCVE